MEDRCRVDVLEAVPARNAWSCAARQRARTPVAPAPTITHPQLGPRVARADSWPECKR